MYRTINETNTRAVPLHNFVGGGFLTNNGYIFVNIATIVGIVVTYSRPPRVPSIRGSDRTQLNYCYAMSLENSIIIKKKLNYISS